MSCILHLGREGQRKKLSSFGSHRCCTAHEIKGHYSWGHYNLNSISLCISQVSPFLHPFISLTSAFRLVLSCCSSPFLFLFSLPTYVKPWFCTQIFSLYTCESPESNHRSTLQAMLLMALGAAPEYGDSCFWKLFTPSQSLHGILHTYRQNI